MEISFKKESRTRSWAGEWRGFTLVEVLVTVGIVLVLAVIGLPAISSYTENAKSVREISAARNLISAWQAYAGDNDGNVLPGYLSIPQSTATTVYNANGKSVGFPTSSRYPFRLAPYFDYQLKGTILVNEQVKLTNDYEISMSPSLGINLTFVGGDFGSGTDLMPNEANLTTYGKFVVTKLSEIHSPSKMLVFASARYTDGTWGKQKGYNAVKSPYLFSKRWQDEFDEKKPYYDYGAVDFRFNKRAVGVMADGHIELFRIEDLMDMRRWSNQAAAADDPNWTLQTL